MSVIWCFAYLPSSDHTTRGHSICTVGNLLPINTVKNMYEQTTCINKFCLCNQNLTTKIKWNRNNSVCPVQHIVMWNENLTPLSQRKVLRQCEGNIIILQIILILQASSCYHVLKMWLVFLIHLAWSNGTAVAASANYSRDVWHITQIHVYSVRSV